MKKTVRYCFCTSRFRCLNRIVKIELQEPGEWQKWASAQQTLQKKTYATSEDSDQPAHPRSLIRVFADRMYILQPPGYPKRDKREHLPKSVDVQADLSLCWSHRSYCRFCRALAQRWHTVIYTFVPATLSNVPCDLRPAETQISLHIHAVRWDYSLSIECHGRFRSDCVDAQADPKLYCDRVISYLLTLLM